MPTARRSSATSPTTRDPVGRKPRAAGAQSAAHPRQQGREGPRASLPMRRPSCPISPRRAPASTTTLQPPPRHASACRSARTRASSAASTTMATPRSNSSPTRLGAQGTVMGGGRYDGLVAEMGGPPRPASAGPPASSGWPCCSTPRAEPRPGRRRAGGRSAEAAAIGVLQSLRHAGIRAEMAYRGNLRRRLERANQDRCARRRHYRRGRYRRRRCPGEGPRHRRAGRRALDEVADRLR